MTFLDILSLLAAGQCLVVLAYLALRRNASFGNGVAQTLLFSSLILAFSGTPASLAWLGLPSSLSRLTALAWVSACAACIPFCGGVLNLEEKRRRMWPALLLIPAVGFGLSTEFSETCAAHDGLCMGVRLEAGWGAVCAAAAMLMIGKWTAGAFPVLSRKDKGPARLTAASALCGAMAMRLLGAVANVTNPEIAAGAILASVAVCCLLLQAVGFALVRLYPEGDREDEATQLGDAHVDRFRRHLAQAVVFEEGGVSPLVRGTMMTTILIVLALVAWSAVTPVKEVSVTSGQVVPTTLIHTVQHLEGGIVAEVLVREGQLVEKGEVLVKLDPAQALAELEQTKAHEEGLLLRAERLRAFAAGRPAKFDQGMPSDRRAQSEDQVAILASQENSRKTSMDVIRKQIEQRKADLDLTRSQMKTTDDQLAYLETEIGMRRELMEQKLTPKLAYLSAARDLERLKGEKARFIAQERTGREALAEAESRLADQESKLGHDALNEMGTVTAELAQVQEAKAKLEDRAARTEIVSPVRGIVQELAVTSSGSVIQAGGVVTKILPADDALVIENQITPRDIGHVSPGQPVRIKVASYDYARFGAVTGTLSRISPSTFLDEKKNPYYKGVVTLDRLYVGTDAKKNHILPGMTVQVDVVTGEKTILQYLLKPIYLAATQAFQER